MRESAKLCLTFRWTARFQQTVARAAVIVRSNAREQRRWNECVELSLTGAGETKRLQKEMRVAPLPFLDWPTDLFARANAVARATPPANTRRRRNEKNCVCGCNQQHNQAVSAVENENGQRRVLWFRTMACRNKHMGIGARVA